MRGRYGVSGWVDTSGMGLCWAIVIFLFGTAPACLLALWVCVYFGVVWNKHYQCYCRVEMLMVVTRHFGRSKLGPIIIMSPRVLWTITVWLRVGSLHGEPCSQNFSQPNSWKPVLLRLPSSQFQKNIHGDEGCFVTARIKTMRTRFLNWQQRNSCWVLATPLARGSAGETIHGSASFQF